MKTGSIPLCSEEVPTRRYDDRRTQPFMTKSSEFGSRFGTYPHPRRLLLEEAQDRLSRGIRLTKDRHAGLLQDLVPRQIGGLRGEVHVADL